ncbi:putative cytochrome P450 oxidoreductase [Colletotrichum godetiae]|uniref:Cytochrome P450 oxidoreductase n=1 Tax=Colletotrichum godetiae TaxID=1209918 RepID=A0AAJ0AIL6_9PEZI|nr:putative cytochrome P450 oxidoreductase [Colletotrichum godetiae]KAK1674584.1 putative cytochrome P450 oxidoreductase [Colletotrichum godetiae]
MCQLAFIILVLGVLLYKTLQIGKRDPRMPPGPPTLPVLGNAHQIPATGLFKQLREWALQYGSIFSLKVGPSSIIVLCDREAIHKLLIEKGSVYSDRPPSYVGKLLTHGDHLALEQMDTTWRSKRKVISHNFSPKRLDEQHFRVQEAEATVLMTRLLDKPEGFFNEIRRYTASVVTSITYGFRAPDMNSFWGHGVYDVMAKWTASMEPGAAPPVDVFTFLRYIPSSMAFWKRRAIDAGKTMDATWSTARRLVEERRTSGERRNCIIDSLLDEYEENGWPEAISQHAFTNLMGEIIEGGADTTAAQLLTLILAFALHPKVQRKAQVEIDEACGSGRSPRWDDFSKLPYVNCIVKEGMRWRPVAVTALPHKVRQDDEYNGMLIPKDSTIFIPTWALHHTEENYPDAERFDPDRYLKHPKLANDYAGSPEWENRDHYNYGAGRRICPGIHLAERNMWRIASKLLWAFEFADPVDPVTGKAMPLDPHAYNPGILQAPLEFDVRITPRSQHHVETILREFKEAEVLLAQYD